MANTNPIDSKKKISQSKDEHIDADFPGYPHYPAKEDIINPENGVQRVEANMNDSNKQGLNNATLSKKKVEVEKTEDELNIKMGTDADISEDDLKGLQALDKGLPEGENVSSLGSGALFEATEQTSSDLEKSDLGDETLRDVTDLDIAGGELDDTDELIGEEDEENNYYSLGGDNKNKLEEDPTAEGY